MRCCDDQLRPPINLSQKLDERMKQIIGRLTKKGVRVEFVKEALTFTGDAAERDLALLFWRD